MMKVLILLMVFVFGLAIYSCSDIDKESRMELNAAVKLMHENKDKDALEHISHAIDMKPEFAEAYEIRSKIYFAAHMFDLAMKDINKAIELNPDFGEAYKSRAYYKASVNDREGACADYSKAKKLGIHNLDNYLKNCP